MPMIPSATFQSIIEGGGELNTFFVQEEHKYIPTRIDHGRQKSVTRRTCTNNG